MVERGAIISVALHRRDEQLTIDNAVVCTLSMRGRLRVAILVVIMCSGRQAKRWQACAGSLTHLRPMLTVACASDWCYMGYDVKQSVQAGRGWGLRGIWPCAMVT